MKSLGTIILSLLILGNLTIANAQKKKGSGKNAVIEKIKAAVESGEITREEAAEKIAGLKKRGGASSNEALGKRLKAAVKAGKLTEEEAKAKFAEMTKKSGKKKPNPNLDGMVKRLKIAVDSGKITEEDAKKRMAEYKKRLSKEGAKKGKSKKNLNK